MNGIELVTNMLRRNLSCHSLSFLNLLVHLPIESTLPFLQSTRLTICTFGYGDDTFRNRTFNLFLSQRFLNLSLRFTWVLTGQ